MHDINTARELAACAEEGRHIATKRHARSECPEGARHDYEPGDVTHPMKSDPDCCICGGRPHR